MSVALGLEERGQESFLSLKGSSRIIESFFSLKHDVFLELIILLAGGGQFENTHFSFKLVAQNRHYPNFVDYVQIFAHIKIVPAPKPRAASQQLNRVNITMLSSSVH